MNETEKTNKVELKAGDTFDFSNFDYKKEEKEEEKNEENTLEQLIKNNKECLPKVQFISIQ